MWAADITYLPMARGFLYLVAIMDWHSWCEVSWRLSNTLEADFCVEALQEALGQGWPEVFNTDQGSQFTSLGFIQRDNPGWFPQLRHLISSRLNQVTFTLNFDISLAYKFLNNHTDGV